MAWKESGKRQGELESPAGDGCFLNYALVMLFRGVVPLLSSVAVDLVDTLSVVPRVTILHNEQIVPTSWEWLK